VTPTAPVEEHLLRELAPAVLGAIVRRFGDFAAAEDAVQEAFIAAARQWPEEGVPANPGVGSSTSLPAACSTTCAPSSRAGAARPSW
jgi:hypothetical protein